MRVPSGSYTIIYKDDSPSARQVLASTRRVRLAEDVTSAAAQVSRSFDDLRRGVNGGFNPAAISNARAVLAPLEAALADFHAELNKNDRRPI